MANSFGVTEFTGYVGDTLTYQTDVISGMNVPTLVTFNWTGVNSIVMKSWQASNASIYENITVNAAEASRVPEPGSTTMLLSGLGIMVFIARRRKSV